MFSQATIIFSVLILFATTATVGQSAEVSVLSANVFTGVLDPLLDDFTKSSGHKVTIVYETAGSIKRKVESGSAGDVTIVTRPMIADLEKAGSVAPGSTADMARSAIAIVVRTNTSKPEFASVEAFKRYLLGAQSISYADPTRGGATGVLATKIFDQLGIAAEIKAKTKLPPPGHFAVELVAAGEVEAAIAQPMEALLQSGVQVAALVPQELQDRSSFTFAVGRMSVAKEPQAADAFIKYLLGPTVQAALKSRGMEPSVEK